MQLASSPKAEPLVLFFCNVISKAPGICEDDANMSQTASAIAAAATAAAGAKTTVQHGGRLEACLREEEPHLFTFLTLAARLLLPQYITPAVVARELTESLQSHMQMQAAECGSPLLPKESAKGQQFRAVAAALIEAKGLLAGLAESDCTEESGGLRSIAHGKSYGKEPQKAGLASFDAWVDQLSRKLNMSRSRVMLFVRIALTGRETGLPLRGLVSSAVAVEIAGTVKQPKPQTIERQLEGREARSWYP